MSTPMGDIPAHALMKDGPKLDAVMSTSSLTIAASALPICTRRPLTVNDDNHACDAGR
jgi:hypothetical protein